MKAIILAAGRGSRMGDLTGQQPKCRTELHGKSLIDWQLEALRGAGIKDIAIVTGYLAETFQFDLQYFHNARWAETNMVMSLYAAREWLADAPCMISYSDIVYSSAAVSKLRDCNYDLAITYDPNWRKLWELRFEDPLDDAETFRIEGDRIIEIGGKTANIDDIQGQYMGLCVFKPAGWQSVEGLLNTLSAQAQDKLDMTSMLQKLIAMNIEINGIAIDDPWYEVDSESDLMKYQGLESLF